MTQTKSTTKASVTAEVPALNWQCSCGHESRGIRNTHCPVCGKIRASLSIQAGERTHQPINQIAMTVGLAQVRKSTDARWDKWAVIYPARETEWYASEAQADKAKARYNNNHVNSPSRQ